MPKNKEYIKAIHTVDCFITEGQYYELVVQAELFSNIIDSSGESACYANGYFDWESIVDKMPGKCDSAREVFKSFQNRRNIPSKKTVLKDTGIQDWGDITKKQILIKHAQEFDDMFLDTPKKARLRESLFDAMEEYRNAVSYVGSDKQTD